MVLSLRTLHALGGHPVARFPASVPTCSSSGGREASYSPPPSGGGAGGGGHMPAGEGLGVGQTLGWGAFFTAEDVEDAEGDGGGTQQRPSPALVGEGRG